MLQHSPCWRTVHFPLSPAVGDGPPNQENKDILLPWLCSCYSMCVCVISKVYFCKPSAKSFSCLGKVVACQCVSCSAVGKGVERYTASHWAAFITHENHTDGKKQQRSPWTQAVWTCRQANAPVQTHAQAYTPENTWKIQMLAGPHVFSCNSMN